MKLVDGEDEASRRAAGVGRGVVRESACDVRGADARFTGDGSPYL